MTVGTMIDNVVRATGSLLTWGTVGISLLMMITLAGIVARRNHLTRQRVISNIAGYLIGAVLWGIGGLFAISPDWTSFQWIAYTLWLTLLVCLSIVMAALWRRYEAGPFPILRGAIARGLLGLAMFVAPLGWADKERERIESLQRSNKTIRDVIKQKQLFGILPENYPAQD